MSNILSLLLVTALAPSAFAGDVVPPSAAPSTAKVSTIKWDARAVEHLLNRATFGPRRSDIEAGLALGPETLVDRLLTKRADTEPPFVEPIEEPLPRALKEMSQEDQQKAKREAGDKERRQLNDYMGWWIDSMTRGDDPLLDRMTLFWHGFFTSSVEQVRLSYAMAKQNMFLRANALGSYSDLLYGIAKDPAMLLFLNNNSNRKGNPNENLARELMELFSLGVGNYTESDVKDAARSLTGRSTTRAGEYEYRARVHDEGDKTVLGTTAKLDGDGLVKILLEQAACPRYVARKIITYFEGVEPDAARLDEYAAFLRTNEFKIQPFLRKLFLDPAFYRDEVVGARVQSPIDYMVGMSRRLGVQAPAIVLGSGAALLGQRLLAPPSVKGWDEGVAWITTSSLMQRGNLAGLMLGLVKMDDVLSQADLLANDADASTPSMQGGATRAGGAQGGGTQGGAMQSGAMQDGSAAGDPMQGGDAKPKASAPMPPAAATPMSREKREEIAKTLKNGKKGGAAYEALRRAQDSGWAPAINFTARMERFGLTTDEQIVDRMLDDLLAIRAPADTRAKMLTFVVDERVQMSVRDGHLLESGPQAERVLRRLAHLILSLPEAQLM